MKILKLSVLSSLMLYLWVDFASASGTYISPPIPDHFKDIPINEKIKIGKALFNGLPKENVKPLPGTHCSGCHSGKERLKRKELKRIREELHEVIKKEHLDRYGKEGDPLEMISIYYYMYTRWRLDR